MEPIGKLPIPAPILIIGKLAMLFCWLFFIVKKIFPNTMFFDNAFTQGFGVSLILLGFLIVILGFIGLGKSVAVGLPEGKTMLKTGGIYTMSRNPMYLGGFLMCAGSCFYSMHIINILLFGITVWIHHSIVLKEEKFLEQRFGEDWLKYKKRVPRYLGIIHRS